MTVARCIPNGHLGRQVHRFETVSHFQTGQGSVPVNNCHFFNQASLTAQFQGMAVLPYGIVVLTLLQTLVANRLDAVDTLLGILEGMNKFSSSINNAYSAVLASLPGPSQLSIACSTVKWERAYYISSRE